MHTVYMGPGDSVHINKAKWDVKVEHFLTLTFQSHTELSKCRIYYEITGKINPGTKMRFTQEWLVDPVPSGSFLLPVDPSPWNTDSSCSQGSLGMDCDFNSRFHWIKLNHHQDRPSLGHVFIVFYNSVGQFLSSLI